MSFTALANAWLLGLLIPLIAFYFLKLKRPRQMIPSLVLWRQVLSDQRVNSPFQRFKRNILLLLQILLLALLALAAMQPFIRHENSPANRLPIMVDTSASMGAADSAGKSRISEAKDLVRKRIETMPADQEICLLSFSNTARKLTGFTNNKRELIDALDTLQAEEIASDLKEALRITEALSRTTPFDRLMILSDGNLPEKTGFDLPFEVEFQKVAPAVANLGISQLNAKRNGSGEWEVLVQISVSANAAPTSARLTLSESNEILAEETLVPTPEGQPRIMVKIPGDRDRLVKVTIAPGFNDSLSCDNTAWIQLPAIHPIDVYVASRLDAVRHALEAMKGVRVFPQPNIPAPSSYDLAFYDAAKNAPSARVLCGIGFIPGDLESIIHVDTKSVEAIDWRHDSALLQYAGLEEVLFMDNPRYTTGKTDSAIAIAGYEILAHGPEGPLIVSKTLGEQLHLHFLFGLDRSTLPFRVAFPIIISNLVQETLRLGGILEASSLATGNISVGNFPPGIAVDVEGPENFRAHDKTDSRGILAAIPAAKSGEYLLKAMGEERRVGVSLLSAGESELASVDKLEFADRAAVSAQSTIPQTNRSLWWTAALLGFAILLVEWWWYQRRAF